MRGVPTGGPPHGRDAGLRLHRAEGSRNCAACRAYAAACRAATRKRAYLRGTASALVDPTGTRRRLQALAAIGWSASKLGEHLGLTRSAVAKLSRQQLVQRATAERIAELYDQLSMQPGPSDVSRRVAAEKGWPPPLAWDDDALDDPSAHPLPVAARGPAGVVDEIAVARAIAGRPVQLNRAEAAEAIRRLDARGLSAAEIAAQIGTNSRRVVRRRAIETTRRTA